MRARLEALQIGPFIYLAQRTTWNRTSRDQILLPAFYFLLIQNSTGNTMLYHLTMIFTVDVEFLAALVLDPLVTIKIKTFNAFESRIIVLHIRWMPAWGWALLFCRMDRWASLGTWGSAECPRACISCTCSWRLRTISGHHITATWNNRPPWRSTWPSQKVWSRYLKRSSNQIKPQDWASFLLFILRMEVINYECHESKKNSVTKKIQIIEVYYYYQVKTQ